MVKPFLVVDPKTKILFMPSQRHVVGLRHAAISSLHHLVLTNTGKVQSSSHGLQFELRIAGQRVRFVLQGSIC